jgi:uncharacterized membrane protein YdjX (TVP38/TMEM64 family)
MRLAAVLLVTAVFFPFFALGLTAGLIYGFVLAGFQSVVDVTETMQRWIRT